MNVSIALVSLTLAIAAVVQYKNLVTKSGISTTSPAVAKILLPAWSIDNKIETNTITMRWILRQCKQPFLNVGQNGIEELLSAQSIKELSPDHWEIDLREDLRWRDGTPVKPEDFIFSWQMRQSQKAYLGIDSIKAMRVKGNRRLHIDFNGASIPSAQQKKIISSQWLTALRPATEHETKLGEKHESSKSKRDLFSPYSLQDELSSPCYGPYDISEFRSDLIVLTRVRQKGQSRQSEQPSERLEVDQSSKSKIPLNRVEVRPIDSSQPLTFDFVSDRMIKGELSFAKGVKAEQQQRSRFISLFRTTLTGSAYYLWVNPDGAFASKDRLIFLHQAINRGELASALVNGQSLRAMHRLVPLSIHDNENLPIISRFTPVNLESIAEASQTLGITVGAPELSKGFAATMQIPEGEIFPMVGKILSGRLRANYLVELNLTTTKDSQLFFKTNKSNVRSDLVLFDVSGQQGLAQWANELSVRLSFLLSGLSSKATRIPQIVEILKQIKTDSLANDFGKATQKLESLDREILGSWNLIPIGQLGFEYLLDPKINNIRIIDDPEVDPDFSEATAVINKDET